MPPKADPLLKTIQQLVDPAIAKSIGITRAEDFASFTLPAGGVPLKDLKAFFDQAFKRDQLVQYLPDPFWNSAKRNGLSDVRLVKLEVAADKKTKSLEKAGFYIGLAWAGSWVLLEDFAKQPLVSLEAIELSLGVVEGDQISSAELFAETKFGGVDCKVFVQLPDKDFTAIFQPGNYQLGSLLQHIGVSDIIFSKLTLDYLEFSGNFEQKHLALTIRVSDIAKPYDWLELSEFDMQVTRQFDASKYTTANFECDGVFFDTPISLSSYYDSDSGWNFNGSVSPEHPISLTHLVDRLLLLTGLSLPAALPDVGLKYLQVDFNPVNSTFSLSGDIGVTNKTQVTLGEKDYDVTMNVEIDIARDPTTHQRSFSGMLHGELQYGAYLFTVMVAIGQKQRLFEGSWQSLDNETLKVENLLELLGIDHLTSGLGLSSVGKIDTTLTEVDFTYDAEAKAFRLIGKSKTFGEAFFVAQKNAQNEWGVVFGLSLKDLHLKDLQGIKDIPGLKDALTLIDLQPRYLMYSTLNNTKLTIPDLSANQAPAALDQPGQSLLMAPGLQIAGTISFGNSNNPIIKAVRKIVSIDQLIGQLIVGQNSLSVRMMLPGRFAIQAGKDTLTLENAYLGLMLAGDTVTASISGTLDANVFGKSHSTACKLEINDDAAVVIMMIKDGPSLPSPALLPGVVLKRDYKLELGVQFEPEGIDLGYMGDFYILDESHTGSATFVLEMIEEVPNPLYLALAMNEMDLMLLFEAYTGLGKLMKEAADATAFIGKADPTHLSKYSSEGLALLYKEYKALEPIFEKVSLNDIYLHWCDSPQVILPDGSVVTAGVGFRCWADIFGFRMYLMVEFNPGKGSGAFKGDAEMMPIKLRDVISITGAGKGITRNTSSWRPGDTPLPNSKDPKTALQTANQLETIVPAGGPVLHVDSSSSPFFYMSVHVSLFDFLSADVEVSITDKGLDFELDLTAGRVAHAQFKCNIHKDGFSASASFGFHLSLDIPPIIPHLAFTGFHLDVGFDGSLRMTIDSNKFEVVIDGSFEFDGATLSLPTITLGVEFKALKDIPKQVEDKILDAAKELFADFIDEAGKLAKEGLKEVEKIGKAAVDDVKQIGEAGLKDVEKIGQGAERAAAAVGEGVKKDAEAVENAAKQIGSDAERDAKEVFNGAKQEAEKLEHEAQKALEGAENKAKELANEVARDVAEVEQKAEEALKDAEKEVGELVGDAARAAKALLDDAGRAAEAALAEAKQIAGKIGDEAKVVWNDVANFAAKAAQAVGSGISSAAHTIASWF